jgi:hypothetical protein
MPDPKQNIKKLYEAVSKEYDLPDFKTFSSDMQDIEKRNKLYTAVSKEYDLPDFDTFSSDIGTPVKKKGATRPTLESTPSRGSLASQGKSDVRSNSVELQTEDKKAAPISAEMQKLLDSTSESALNIAKKTGSKSRTGVLLGTEVKKIDPILLDKNKPFGDIGDKETTVQRASVLQEQSNLRQEQLKEEPAQPTLESEGKSEGFIGGLKGQDKSTSSFGKNPQIVADAIIGGAVDMLGSTYSLSGWAAEMIGLDAISTDAYQKGGKLSEISQNFATRAKTNSGIKNPETSTFDHFLQGEVEDGFRSLGVDVLGQIPNIALAIATGGESLAVKEAARKHIAAKLVTKGVAQEVAIKEAAQMAKSLTAKELATFAVKEIPKKGIVEWGKRAAASNTTQLFTALSTGSAITEEYAKDQDISALDAAQSVAKGVFDGFSENIFNMDIVAGRSLLGLDNVLTPAGRAIRETIKRDGKDAALKQLIRGWRDVAGKFLKGGGQETIEENVVAVASFIIDAIDTDNLNMEGFTQLGKTMGNATLVSFTSGSSLSGAAAMASFKPLTKQESRKIEQYKEILANENISLGTKNIAKNRIEEINAGVETATSERYDKIVALPIEDRIDILDKQAKIQTLEADKVATMDVEINSAIDERITELNAEIDAKINPKVEPALPSEISGFLTERNNETLSSVEQRIDNAELINENDIAGATSPLYDAIDGISKDKSLSEGDKQAAISLIEDKITKLESYEFETETKIIQPEQERPVLVSKQIIGKVTRGSKNPSEVTKGRFDGKQASVNETDGVIVYDEKADVLSVVHDDGRTDLDFNYLEYQESSLDEDGNLQSVKLVDKRNGDEVSINDQDLAYDIAIKAKTQQLGEIQDAVFDEVYETVKQEAITKEVVKEKPTIPLVNNNQEGVKQEKQQIKDFGVAEDQVEPVHNLISRLFQGLKESGLTAANTVGEWVGIGKGKEKPYSLKINGKDVQVKNTSPEVVNGFYSPLEKIISKAQVAELNTTLRVELNKVQKQLQDYYQAAKKGIAVELPNGVFWEKALKEQVAKLKEQISSSEVKTDNFSLTVDEWKSKLNESEEAKWTGLTDWLSQQEGSVSKADIQQYLKDNRIQVVEVVKGELTEKEIKEKDRLLKELDDVGVKITLSILDGDKVKQNELEAKEEELFEKLKPLSDRTNQDLTKFSQYQLEGEKENYKEVLVTMPSETNFEIVKWKDGGYVLKVNGNNYAFNESIDNLKQVQSEIENGKRKGDDAKFKSSHFDEPNILVHLRMNTRTDAEGNKVLFLEEVQSDWGQEGKRKGFNKEPKYKSMPSGNEFRNQIEKKLGNVQDIVIDKNEFGDSVVIRKDNKFYIADLENGKINVDEIYEADAPDFFKEYSTSIPSAPFVMDTNAWTKLGLKYALKEAVAQGVDKIAWTTGEQQNERYSLEKIADEVRYSKNPDGTYKIIAYKDGENISENKRLNEKDLESNFGKDVAQRIIDGVGENIEGEKSLTGENLKVGGKGMKGFYGSPTEGSLGIVGNVAKSLFKQEPKTVEIKVKGIADFNKVNTKKDIEVYSEQKYKFYENQEEVSKQRAYEIIEGGDWLTAKKPIESIQHSIDVTPELKESVEGGQPLFKDAEAQYRIESGKNIVEAIKDFNGSARAVVALTHEIMHPTVVAIIDGAKRNSKNGLKHTQTIIDEFNKANPKRKVTVEQLIQGNDDFKGGKTSKEYRAVQEFIAKSWEKYHREGGKGFSQQFQEVLEQIKKAFRDVYKSTSGKKLTPELRVMFDEILGKQNPTTSNQGGSNKPPTPPVVPPANNTQGGLTPEEADAKVVNMMAKGEKQIRDGGKKDWWNTIKRYVLNRRTDLDKQLNKSEAGQRARKFNENVSGSISHADDQYQASVQRIYAKHVARVNKKFGKLGININQTISELSGKEEADVNAIIFLNRVINIDQNTAKKNKKTQTEIDTLTSDRLAEPNKDKKKKITKKIQAKIKQLKEDVKHPDGFNESEAKIALEGMKNRIGDKAFTDLEGRANAYSEIRREMLREMHQEGLISDDTLDNLLGDSYVERKFLDHIFDDSNFSAGDSSLSSNMIKALMKGSEGLLITDARLLLHSAYRAQANRIATNKANTELANAVRDGGMDKSFAREAKFKKNLNGTYKKDKLSGNRVLESAPIGMKPIYYYKNGERHAVFVRTKEADQWNDTVKLETKIDPVLKFLSGTKVLKTFATLMNPLFAVSNTFRDFQKVLGLSDTYDKNVLTAFPRLLANFSGKASQYTAYKVGVATESFSKLIEDYTKAGGKFEFLHRDGKNDRLYRNTINRNKPYVVKLMGKSYNMFENAFGLPGEISEISMRLAVFDKKRADLIEDMGGKGNLSKAEMDDINILAANASRAIMDYNKGGLATKWLDNFSPYLNASVVGFVSDVDYIAKNPKMAAAKLGMYSLNVAAITLFNAINSDEEDYKNIPDYVKDNYYIFFIPGKFGGVKKYLPIPKYQGLQPIASMVEEATLAMWNSYNDANYGKADSTVDRAASTLATWSPIPFTPRGVMMKLSPSVQAGIAYFGNYDSYRDQTVEYKKGEVSVGSEGLYNKKIARTYKVLGDMSKALGPDFELSPSRTQAAMEKIITNPRTNFLIGNIYGISDWITQNYQIPMELEASDKNTIGKSVKHKFIRDVDPAYASRASTSVKQEEYKINDELNFLQKSIKLMVLNNASTEEMRDFIQKQDLSKEEKQSLEKRAQTIQKDIKIALTTPFYDELVDIKYLQFNPEKKARIVFQRFVGMDPKSDDFQVILESSVKMGILSKKGTRKNDSSYQRFLKEYQKKFDSNQ